MEFYYQYFSSGGYSEKEKRPPLKRGQLKRQIVRTICNLVVPSGGGGDGPARIRAHVEQQKKKYTIRLFDLMGITERLVHVTYVCSVNFCLTQGEFRLGEKTL
ncbi:hypothetical protein HU200_024254 [Digitaria exilis]|uniref:Uncharacterized protein n=1 Tax=Digitaria exilis TaxID=1010633 RepID=A0A835EWU6_9POAL|nr:hypothetical protein HU200_024254 [Digitaria exilis]